MIDERKIPKSKTEDLELNRETVADLTEGEAEQVQGGVGPGGEPGTNPSAGRARYSCAFNC